MYLHGSWINANGEFMKGAIDVRVILGLGLLAIGGAHAPAAAEVVGDGQEQARELLSGRGASSSGPMSGFVSPSSSVAKAIAPDAQAQAREMILGRQIGSRSAGSKPKIRLAGKTE
jgi:hypothetical protein